MILTENDWIAWCIRAGWKHTDIPALRELWRKRPHKFRDRIGTYVIKYKDHIIGGGDHRGPHKFGSRLAAFKWANWNYKGRGGWEVLTLAQATRRRVLDYQTSR